MNIKLKLFQISVLLWMTTIVSTEFHFHVWLSSQLIVFIFITSHQMTMICLKNMSWTTEDILMKRVELSQLLIDTQNCV